MDDVDLFLTPFSRGHHQRLSSSKQRVLPKNVPKKDRLRVNPDQCVSNRYRVNQRPEDRYRVYQSLKYHQQMGFNRLVKCKNIKSSFQKGSGHLLLLWMRLMIIQIGLVTCCCFYKAINNKRIKIHKVRTWILLHTPADIFSDDVDHPRSWQPTNANMVFESKQSDTTFFPNYCFVLNNSKKLSSFFFLVFDCLHTFISGTHTVTIMRIHVCDHQCHLPAFNGAM